MYNFKKDYMKTIKLCLLLTVAVLSMTSCENHEVEMNTFVNEDGTCSRNLFFKTDSAGLVGNLANSDGVIRLSDDWNVFWAVKGKSEWHDYPMSVEHYNSLQAQFGSVPDTVILRAERKFASVEEMSAAFPIQIAGKPLTTKAEFTKRFRWFYTIYEYTETIDGFKECFHVPFNRFMNENDAFFWFTGEPEIFSGYTPFESYDKLSKIEESVNRWLNANYFCEMYNVMVRYYDSVKNPPVDKNAFVSLRDSVMQYALAHGFDISLAGTDKIFSGFFGSDAYAFMFKGDSECMMELSERIRWFADLVSLDINYSVYMPGQITDTGRGLYHDSTGCVYYSLTGGRFIPDDYIITASSRVTNIWAYAITAILATVVLVLCLRAKR